MVHGIMFKILYKKPFYLSLLLCSAILLGYWLGQRPMQKLALRPAVLLKERPAKRRVAKKIPASRIEKVKKDNEKLKLELQTQESNEVVPPLLAPSEMDLQQLTDEVITNLKKKNVTEDELKRTIAVSEELINRDPSLYTAYKTKLLSLIKLETQFGQDVPVEDYEELYDEMLSFDGVNAVDEMLAEVRTAATGEVEVDSAELQGIDQDLIHIPFLRFSALNDVESLADISEEYIESFPDSYIGYLYLAEALWRDGDQVEATAVLQDGLKQGSDEKVIPQLLLLFQVDPRDRLNLFSYD